MEGLTVSGVRVVAADGVFSPLLFHLQQKAGSIILIGGLGNPQILRKLPNNLPPHTHPAAVKNKNKALLP